MCRASAVRLVLVEATWHSFGLHRRACQHQCTQVSSECTQCKSLYARFCGLCRHVLLGSKTTQSDYCLINGQVLTRPEETLKVVDESVEGINHLVDHPWISGITLTYVEHPEQLLKTIDLSISSLFYAYLHEKSGVSCSVKQVYPFYCYSIV